MSDQAHLIRTANQFPFLVIFINGLKRLTRLVFPTYCAKIRHDDN